MPPRMLLRQNIHSAKKGEMRARFSLRFLLSFVFPVVPPINSLSLDPSRANVYDEEKHRHRETTRDSIKPRLKYQEQHALSLSRDVHARGERERHTKTTRENKKRTSRDTIDEGFSPTHKCSFLYRENVSVCSNIKRKQKTKDGKLKRQKKPRSSPVCVSEARSLGLRKETDNEVNLPSKCAREPLL